MNFFWMAGSQWNSAFIGRLFGGGDTESFQKKEKKNLNKKSAVWEHNVNKK